MRQSPERQLVRSGPTESSSTVRNTLDGPRRSGLSVSSDVSHVKYNREYANHRSYRQGTLTLVD